MIKKNVCILSFLKLIRHTDNQVNCHIQTELSTSNLLELPSHFILDFTSSNIMAERRLGKSSGARRNLTQKDPSGDDSSCQLEETCRYRDSNSTWLQGDAG